MTQQRKHTESNDASRIRAAIGKPAATRRKIARELEVHLSTLDRKCRLLKRGGPRALQRLGRTDRGKSRKLPEIWTSFLAKRFFLKRPAVSYADLRREVAELCSRRGVAPPSYSLIRRQINAAFARTVSGRIQVIGDFVRRKPAR